MIKRLRIKFVAVNMAIVTVLLGAIFGLVLYFTQAQLEQESLLMMERIATQPLALTAPGEAAGDVQLPFFALQLGPYGEIVATGGGFFDLSDRELLASLIEAVMSAPQHIGVLEEYHLRYYRWDGPVQRCLVFADITSEQATLRGLERTCLLLGIVSFGVLLWVSILLSKWAVAPVARAMEQQRQFVAAASHELKTPLSVILANAELLQQEPPNTPRREALLSPILTMSHRMRSLITQLLELTRLDGSILREAMEAVDLSDTVEAAALTFEPVFFEASMTLSWEIAPGIFVFGAAQALTEAVEILLDNARKYATGSWAKVRLARSGRGRCQLTVENPGPPIDPADREAIFKPFYRVDAARNGSSFGLGLAIAQKTAAQHKGRIWAESRDGLNRFILELPTLSQE